MNNIDIASWGEFRIGTLFDIHPTKSYKLTNAILFEDNGENPVVVNSSFNNGIGGYTNRPTTEKGNIITFSDTTSADAIFYQENNFVGYPHVQGMYPIGEYEKMWNKYSLMFFVTIFRIKAIGMNFDYVNKFTRETAVDLKVKLPINQYGKIDFEYMEKFMKDVEEKAKTSFEMLNRKKQVNMPKINISNWKNFHLYDIFHIDPGTKLDKSKMDTTIEKINFVGRSNFNNGITQKVNEIDGIKPFPAGYLTLALGGAYLGSCFVQKEAFYTSQNVVVLIPKDNINYETKQFIATAIFRESQNNYKAFIKELNRHIKRDFVIKLPVDEKGNPDYEYMSEFMKKIQLKVDKKMALLKLLCEVKNNETQ